MNYRLDIQYDGSRYGGWQRQKDTDNTIQGKIEDVLTKMLGTEVQIQGAGRTDAGVHAKGQVANFHAECEKSCEEICQYLNEYLPEDIEISKVSEAEERFHSRLNAKRRYISIELYPVFIKTFLRESINALSTKLWM